MRCISSNFYVCSKPFLLHVYLQYQTCHEAEWGKPTSWPHNQKFKMKKRIHWNSLLSFSVSGESGLNLFQVLTSVSAKYSGQIIFQLNSQMQITHQLWRKKVNCLDLLIHFCLAGFWSVQLFDDFRLFGSGPPDTSFFL